MTSPQPTRYGTGLLAAIIGVAVLTAFAAWAPASVRKLGLFSIVFGICVGSIARWSSGEFGLSRRITMTLAVLLTFIGLTVVALLGAHRLQAERLAAAKANPEQTMAISVMEAAAKHDPQVAADLQTRRRAEHRRLNPTFADYLAVRTSPLGEWSQPWPSLFWGIELLLAAIASALVVRRTKKPSV